MLNFYTAIITVHIFNTDESCFEVKLEADDNDITEHPDEFMPSTGIFVLKIVFIDSFSVCNISLLSHIIPNV